LFRHTARVAARPRDLLASVDVLFMAMVATWSEDRKMQHLSLGSIIGDSDVTYSGKQMVAPRKITYKKQHQLGTYFLLAAAELQCPTMVST